MNKFKVVCLNDKQRPKEINPQNWVEQEEIYTVVKVQTMANQGNIAGFILEEIQPNPDSGYDSYKATRFAPVSTDDIKALEAVKELVKETLTELVELN